MMWIMSHGNMILQKVSYICTSITALPILLTEYSFIFVTTITLTTITNYNFELDHNQNYVKIVAHI